MMPAHACLPFLPSVVGSSMRLRVAICSSDSLGTGIMFRAKVDLDLVDVLLILCRDLSGFFLTRYS